MEPLPPADSKTKATVQPNNETLNLIEAIPALIVYAFIWLFIAKSYERCELWGMLALIGLFLCPVLVIFGLDPVAMFYGYALGWLLAILFFTWIGSILVRIIFAFIPRR